MSAEWFLKLKEFDSLTKMRINHLKAVQEQKERLEKLNVKRQEQLDSTNTLKSELMTLQQKYFETEQKLKSAEQQAQRLKDIGGDEAKIALFAQEASLLETALFEMLERLEKIQLAMDEIKTFLAGLDKTIQEISTEVKAEIEIQDQAISQLDLRLKLIQEELPEDFRSTLDKTLKKNLAVGPFTRVENGSCFFCRFKISRIEESEIDMQRALKLCPQCSRIFLPYGS